MNEATNWIAQALTPGVGLTCVILYNTSLQSRFVYITGRVRELNREARALLSQKNPEADERVLSLRWQVDLMSRRSLIVRRAVLTAYGAFLGFIATIFALAAAARFPGAGLDRVPFFTFAVALLCLVGASLLSISEMYLAFRTLSEDTRTTYRGEASTKGLSSAGPQLT